MKGATVTLSLEDFDEMRKAIDEAEEEREEQENYASMLDWFGDRVMDGTIPEAKVRSWIDESEVGKRFRDLWLDEWKATPTGEQALAGSEKKKPPKGGR